MDRTVQNVGSTIGNTLNVTTLSEEIEAKEQDDSEATENLPNALLHSFNREPCCLETLTTSSNNNEAIISKSNSNVVKYQNLETGLPNQPNCNWETPKTMHTQYKPVEGDGNGTLIGPNSDSKESYTPTAANFAYNPNQASDNKEHAIVTKDAFGVNTQVTLSDHCHDGGSHSTAV